MSWRDEAACLGTFDPSFFMERGETSRRAKSICAQCPVTVECLDFAIDYGAKFGVWGGLSEKERRKVKRQRLAA